jgi:hypothetical protein
MTRYMYTSFECVNEALLLNTSRMKIERGTLRVGGEIIYNIFSVTCHIHQKATISNEKIRVCVVGQYESDTLIEYE